MLWNAAFWDSRSSKFNSGRLLDWLNWLTIFPQIAKNKWLHKPTHVNNFSSFCSVFLNALLMQLWCAESQNSILQHRNRCNYIERFPVSKSVNGSHQSDKCPFVLKPVVLMINPIKSRQQAYYAEVWPKTVFFSVHHLPVLSSFFKTRIYHVERHMTKPPFDLLHFLTCAVAVARHTRLSIFAARSK